MEVKVTDGRVDAQGVFFRAECERGAGSFIVSKEALADLDGAGADFPPSEWLRVFEDNADAIGEAAGLAIAQGRAGGNARYLISSAELPGTR